MTTSISSLKAESVVNDSFEQILQTNEKDFVVGLVKDYGLDALKSMWEKMSPLKKQKFVQGEENLSDYETLLRQKCQAILVTKVKGLNPKTLQKLHTSDTIINKLLLQCSSSELQTLASKEESLDAEYQTFADRCRKYEQAEQNKALINYFETAYSKEVFQEVYGNIPEKRRTAIDNGEISLVSYIDVLRKKCEEKRTSSFVGTLPSKDEFVEFFKKAKVVGYAEGAQGVFFVEGILNGAKQKFVVKASDKPAQETFATELVASLHIKTPASCSIDSEKDSDLFKAILKSLEKNESFQEKYEDQMPKQFSIMTYVPGTTLENLKAKDIEGVLKDNPDLFYDQVLFELGQIAAIDFLLYYQDRLPVIGGGNTANIMILKNEEGQCVSAVGIDQVASLTKQETSVFKKQDPFKRVQEFVDPIVSEPEKISQAAKDIFEDGLDSSVKDVLNEDRALRAIQKGIVSGLSKVATFSPEKLAQIHGSLPSSPYKRDQVDLEAYQTMLKTLHSSLLN